MAKSLAIIFLGSKILTQHSSLHYQGFYIEIYNQIFVLSKKIDYILLNFLINYNYRTRLVVNTSIDFIGFKIKPVACV